MLNQNAVMDRYYPDCRCMALELAATLDRHQSAAPAPGGSAAADERLRSLHQALQILIQPSAHPDRAERILRLLSDPVD